MNNYGILALQFEPRINNIEKNLETVKFQLQNFCEQLDLIILPEFFSTGINHQGFIDYAENEQNPNVLNFLSNLAKEKNSNIIGGTIIEKDGENFYNTSYIFDRNGEIKAKYRKIHLYSYFGGKENEVITEGNNPPVTVELDFAKIGVGICFDLRFPMHFNKLMKMGAEIIACPNAWCLPQKSTNYDFELKKREMKAFSITRAVENLCYFAGASFIGSLGSGLNSCANSIIVSPVGEILAIGEDKPAAIYSKIDMDFLRNLRKEFPINKID